MLMRVTICLVCVVHRLCLAPKSANLDQRHNLFHTRGTVKDKTVDIIIDNSSNGNLVLAKAVAALKLHIKKHLKPYKLGWIKHGDAVKVAHQCVVPLFIGKH